MQSCTKVCTWEYRIWGFEWNEMLRGYQMDSVTLCNSKKEESNSLIQKGEVVSPCECNLQIVVLITYKDFEWNHCACLIIKTSISQTSYTCQLGQALFPCQQAGVKALLIIILPARKWISPSFYPGSEKLLASGRDYKMESFYSWHLQSQLLLMGQLKIHVLCLWQENIFYKLLANTSQRSFI